ncbi:SPFH domain / Band 7 family protein [Anatilimnocola aggregata]|uniref:SPFH domain / Band 7 family protein n=1 Tax=Anatilimnocola aggregata TaxID=2528021 RepID=A0A517Y558_9BACT|nr:slipin family protein [Anatilimnocola aggregata]QDU25379.1 SPFH domain / Band 7 family protein [Anatilimnocola aggregata]
MFHRIKILSYEMGLVFRDREFVGLLGEGTHWRFDPWSQSRVTIVSRREPWLAHEKLDLIVKSGLLAGQAEVLDVQDQQRALVWIEGRFSQILGAGLYAYWLGQKRVNVEMIDIRQARFEHKDLKVIARTAAAKVLLDICEVQRDRVGVLFIDGRYIETLAPGQYAFWKGAAEARVVEVDMRETAADISGQEIMTADKVTLRVNALVTYRIVDARRAVSAADDARQALYREAQLALRAIIGGRELDAFLAGKDEVAQELSAAIRVRAAELGIEVIAVGIRDVILPGEMKDLMNRVTEAKKAAEANLIARREETAAIRSQANTAKLLADQPTLMRLRELEVLEKIASAGQLKIVLGGDSEKGLANRVVNLL